MLRIGVVTAIPTPYRDPFWNAVASQPETALHVYYCAATTDDRPWTPSWQMHYESEFLPGMNVFKRLPSQGFIYWNPRIISRLREGRHDALIVGGYNYPTMIATMHFARRHRVPYFLMSESHLNEPKSTWRRLLKRPLVRWAVGGAAGCLPTGTWARDYLMHYGADPARMCFMPNVPDVDQLDATARELAGRRPEVRRQLGFGDGPLVLYIGRLVPFKRVDVLLEAFVRAGLPASARLAIVGDGVMRPELEALAGRLGLGDRVVFRGFVEPADVPLWYAAADVLALPSVGETWSVTLLEALASGLPVVTTDSVGAAADAIGDPAVGTIVRSGDVDELATAIAARIADPAGRTLVPERWAATREQFSYKVQARRVVDAIRNTVRTGAPATAR